VFKNPQTVILPAAAPIDARWQADFLTRSAPLLASLETARGPDARLALKRRAGAARVACRWYPEPMDSPDLKAPQQYINRELSFLEFNQRVLDQAFDESVPLLERLKFLCISCSNLDEFFEIRVAGLKQLQELGGAQLAADGMSIPEQLTAIHDRATRLVADQYRCLNSLAAARARP